MILMAQMEQIFQFFQKMTKKLEQPFEIEKLNYQNHTTWCTQMKTEFSDRGRLNHITAIFPSTTNLQWVQNDCMVISWIINNIDRDLVEYFLDYTTSARDLWTRIYFILGPVPLPPVDETIQREVARGRCMVEKTSSRFNPSENQKPKKKQTKTKI